MARQNCGCVVAQGGTYLVDGEWTINPNIWTDINGGLISDGHNRIVAPAGSGEQVFLNHDHNCWSSRGIRAGVGGYEFGREAWVRVYVAAKPDMSAWLAVEGANTELNDDGDLRCINLRVMSHAETFVEWRTSWSTLGGGAGVAYPAAAYDADAHRLYYNFGTDDWLYVDLPGSPSDYGRYAGFGCRAHDDHDVVFDSPSVSMFGLSDSNGCEHDCGSIAHGNVCDPLTEAFGPLYEEPDLGDTCYGEHGWQTTHVGADPWTLNDAGAEFNDPTPANPGCEATARRRIRVTDCTNSITITIRTWDHPNPAAIDTDHLVKARFSMGPYMGGEQQEVSISDKFTIETMTISNIPLGDCFVEFLVSRGTVPSNPCFGVDRARMLVDLVGAVWMEAPP